MRCPWLIISFNFLAIQTLFAEYTFLTFQTGSSDHRVAYDDNSLWFHRKELGLNEKNGWTEKSRLAKDIQFERTPRSAFVFDNFPGDSLTNDAYYAMTKDHIYIICSNSRFWFQRVRAMKESYKEIRNLYIWATNPFASSGGLAVILLEKFDGTFSALIEAVPSKKHVELWLPTMDTLSDLKIKGISQSEIRITVKDEAVLLSELDVLHISETESLQHVRGAQSIISLSAVDAQPNVLRLQGSRKLEGDTIIDENSQVKVPLEEIPINTESDINAFLYTLGAAKGESTFIEGQNKISQLARAELLVTQQKAEDLYRRLAKQLERLHPSLRILKTIQTVIEQNNFNSEVRCSEVGLCASLLIMFGIRIGAGLIVNPESSTPVLSFKAHLGIPISAPSLGASLEMGSSMLKIKKHHDVSMARFSIDEKTTSDNLKTRTESYSGLFGSYARKPGIYESNDSGMTIGLQYSYVEQRGFELKLPLPFLRTKYNYKLKLQEILFKIVQAFHSFDFERLSILIPEFENELIRVTQKLEKRGLDIKHLQLETLGPEHPFYSVGNLFHPRFITRVSPELVSDFIKEGNPNCELPLLTDKKRNRLLMF